MKMSSTAQIPAASTWQLGDLAEKRIAYLQLRIAKLSPNQRQRRRDYETQLRDLETCLAAIHTAQTAYAHELADRLVG